MCRQHKVCVCMRVCGIREQEAVQNWMWLRTTGREVCQGKGTTKVTATWSKTENKKIFFLSLWPLSHNYFFSYLPIFPLIKAQCVSQPPQSSGFSEESTMTMLPKRLSPLQGCSQETLKVKKCFSGENEIKSKLIFCLRTIATFLSTL